MDGLRLTVLFLCAFLTSRTFGDEAEGPAVFQITDPVDHGEGPTWDARTGLLYFVDIFSGRVMSYSPATSRVAAIAFQGTVTPVIPSKADPHLLVVGVNRTVTAVKWDGKEEIGATKGLVTLSGQFPTSRLNDGKADKRGRLWWGTMGFENNTGVVPDEGVLYFITKDNIQTPTAVLHPVTVSNGMAWNKANDKYYYIDTPTRQVVGYDFDDESGKISNPTVVLDLAKYPTVGGFPDGMTIDKDDNLWIALYNGGSVIQVDPGKGEILKMVPIPAQAVTSLSWGGEHLDVLYVTTSKRNLGAAELEKQPTAGSLFAVKNLGTSGVPAFEADVIDKVD